MGYGRYGNPVWTAFEDVVSELEGGRSLVFASGMAAVSAVTSLVDAGGVVVVPHIAYSGVHALLRQEQAAGRITVRRVDPFDDRAYAQAVDGADLVWLESPSNPLVDVLDLSRMVRSARDAGARTVVDATFATPLRLRPLDPSIAADVSLHSATKLMSGHSDVLLGVVSVTGDGLHERLDARRRYSGGVPGPMEAWLALRGLRTLHVRLDRAEATATELTARLRAHAHVSGVRYPGFGTMLALELPDAERADAVVAALRLWVATTSLGGTESTVERRRRWPEESPQVPEGLLRLSVGLEDVEDLWSDLLQALPH